MSRDSIKFKWNNQTLAHIQQNVLNRMYEMGVDIETNAKKRAPYLTGALSDSIRTLRFDSYGVNEINVVAGGIDFGYNVPYALVREYGPNKDKATEHYMQNAMDTIMSGDYMSKYFKGVAK